MRHIILFLFCFCLNYCGIADLREGKVLQSAEREKDGQTVCENIQNSLQSKKLQQFTKIYTRGKDSWNSYWIRKFTPVFSAEQVFVAELGIQERSIRYQMLDSNGKLLQVIGIELGKTYRETAGSKIFVEDKEVRLYLQSFLDYFFWPHTLCGQSFIYALPNENTIKQVFISTKAGVPLAEKDQFIVSLSPKACSIQFIDFTMRSFLESYRGTLAYSNWKSYQGIALPHSIRIQDTRNDTSYVHEFTFDSFQIIGGK